MNEAERWDLHIQKKILDRVVRQTKDQHGVVNKLRKVFLSLHPDEFGNVSKTKFIKNISKEFHMTDTEAQRLYDRGVGSQDSYKKMHGEILCRMCI